eukprot:2543155-Heterocapsa_arctica.AAC.1
MSTADRASYDAVHGAPPFLVCSRHWSPVTRPRLWWFSDPPTWPQGTQQRPDPSSPGVVEIIPQVPSDRVDK